MLNKNKFYKLFRLVVSIIACQMAGVIGAIFTTPKIGSWYLALQKPSFNPPSWIFGPVWTVLFFLMGIALFLVWEKGFTSKKAKTALLFFIGQLLLNILWSILFFGLGKPLFAFIEIFVLWGFIALTILSFVKISKVAAWLLLPYLYWVAFASLLNVMIVLLN
ncbi:MAG: TspO/MBR family protein [bacterium]|nr:TspO/MBR family protein [bacterium]